MEKFGLPRPIDTYVDPWSLVTTRVDLAFGDISLGSASGFYWKVDQTIYLITNWHVVTGRNADTGQPLKGHGAVPDSLSFRGRPTNGGDTSFTVQMKLGETSGWLIHPELGKAVDVVAVPVPSTHGLRLSAANALQSAPLPVHAGRDAFVLGYPLPRDVAGLPIWKRASLANDPALMDAEHQYLLIDTATREGMSGAPVIMRAFDGGPNGSGIVPGHDATRLIGVYSGRFIGDQPDEFQLGRVWPDYRIAEIIGGGRWEGTQTVAW